MNKHTPGPWHVGGIEKCTIYDERSQRVANSFEGVMVTHRSDAKCQANARLIAAAPELYEALKNCVTALAHVSERMGMKVDHPFLEELRAVLAKVDA